MLGTAWCRASRHEPRVHAVLTRQGKDTLRIDAPLRAFRCAGPGAQSGGVGGAGGWRWGLLLQGVRGGDGVLVWLRAADSVTPGAWPLLQRGDTLTPRGATVVARFMVGDAARGATLDSGTVWVTRADSLVSLVARGRMTETLTATPMSIEATFEAAPVGTDTLSCRSQL